MWVFWILAGALAAAAALAVVVSAASASRAASRPSEDPKLAVYRRQLAELDAQAERGLLGPAELQAARAEASRRLLAAADSRHAPEQPGGRSARLIVTLGVAGAAVTALALYLMLGSPGLGDQPYRTRLQAWRSADPSTLDPVRMAAVLRDIAAERPRDAEVFGYLGRAEYAAGDAYAASRAFQRAAALAPRNAGLQAALGQALVADADGAVTPQAQSAFQQALALDPADDAARYYLGKAEIAGGNLQAGLARWRALAQSLGPADPHQAQLLAEIDRASGRPAAAAAAPGSAAPPSAMGGGQMAFIRAMVATQAAALQAHPDDADGWARLVRSYGVLGDKPSQDRALAAAHRQFAARPALLARIEAEARPDAGAAPAPR